MFALLKKLLAWLPLLRNCMHNGRDQKNRKFSIFFANAPVTHAYRQQNKYVARGLYQLNWSKSRDKFEIEMKSSLKLITKWLTGSGLKVNEPKLIYSFSIKKTVLRLSSVLET